MANAGIAIAPDWLIHDKVERGELVALLPEFATSALEINAVYPSARHVSTKVRYFIEFLQKEFKAIPAFAGVGTRDEGREMRDEGALTTDP